MEDEVTIVDYASRESSEMKHRMLAELTKVALSALVEIKEIPRVRSIVSVENFERNWFSGRIPRQHLAIMVEGESSRPYRSPISPPDREPRVRRIASSSKTYCKRTIGPVFVLTPSEYEPRIDIEAVDVLADYLCKKCLLVFANEKGPSSSINLFFQTHEANVKVIESETKSAKGGE